ncbi:MAG: phosphopantothenoylcysteine decarboxylase, partial [Phenylobacterium zucineum]
SIRRNGFECVSVGFAAETGSGEQLLGYAKSKLEAKGCDLIVANDVSGGAVFGADSNSVTIVAKDGSLRSAQGGKAAVARAVVDAVVALI